MPNLPNTGSKEDERSKCRLLKLYSLDNEFSPFVTILCYAVISLISPVLCAALHGLTHLTNGFMIEFKTFFYGVGSFISWFLVFAFQLFHELLKKLKVTEKKINESLKSYNEQIDEKIDEHLKNARIVFETGIKDYDDTYLLLLQKILNELENLDDVKTIYLIDHSDPIQWWSDSMTGYLSLLAKWRANKPIRRVHRIFVLSKNELLSPVTIKTIAFHSLLGFNTYVFEEEQYKALFKEYTAELGQSCKIKMKELLMWTISSTSVFHPVSFHVNSAKWGNILLYQSFWDIDRHKKSIRKFLMKTQEFDCRDYKGELIKDKIIDVWFEFLPQNDTTKIIATQHLGLVKFLRSKSYCCQYPNDLSKACSLGEHFGVEIKTNACISCGITRRCEKCLATPENGISKFEYINSQQIKEILLKYTKKL